MLRLVLYGRLLSDSLCLPPSLSLSLSLSRSLPCFIKATRNKGKGGCIKTSSALIFPLSPSTFPGGIPETSLLSLLSFISRQKKKSEVTVPQLAVFPLARLPPRRRRHRRGDERVINFLVRRDTERGERARGRALFERCFICISIHNYLMTNQIWFIATKCRNKLSESCISIRIPLKHGPP